MQFEHDPPETYESGYFSIAFSSRSFMSLSISCIEPFGRFSSVRTSSGICARTSRRAFPMPSATAITDTRRVALKYGPRHLFLSLHNGFVRRSCENK